MPLMASVGEEPTYSGWTEQSQVSFLLSLGRGAKAPRFKFLAAPAAHVADAILGLQSTLEN